MTDNDEPVEVLKDIRRWVKIIGLQEAKPVLKEALSDEDEQKQRDLRITYHHTNGENSIRAITDMISYSRGWVSDRYKEWSNMGLIERDSQSYSYRHIISLEEAGMDVPEPREPDNETEDEEEISEPENEEAESQETANLTDYE